MEDINERLHVPDIDNVTKLVDIIFETIYNKAIVQIEQYDDSNDIDVKRSFEGEFTIGDIENPCSWLADDNVILYNIHFDSVKTYGSSFETEQKYTYVEFDENDKPVKLHMSGIRLDFNVGESMPNDRNEMRHIFEQFKVDTRHELTHAYKEMFTHLGSRVKSYNGKIDDYDLSVSAKEYRRGCVNINKWIKNHFLRIEDMPDNLKSDPDILERVKDSNFINALYLLTYDERDARVSEFYQELLDDLKRIGKLKPIDKYNVYKSYVKAAYDIDDFNNYVTFNRCKQHIIKCLFGKACDSLPITKRKLSNHVDKVLSRLYNIYTDVYLRKNSIINGSNNMGIDESHKLYMDRKLQKCAKVYGDGINDDNRYLMKILTEHYHYSYKDRYIDQIKYFFNSDETFENRFFVK